MEEEKAVANTEQTELEQGETAAEIVEAVQAPEPTFTKKEVEDEKSKVQSAFERKLAEERKERESLASRLAEAERLRQAEEYRRKQDEEIAQARYIEELEQLPEGQKLSAAFRQTQSEKVRVKELERLANERYNQGLIGLKLAKAHELGEEHGIDWKSLMDAPDEVKMENMALKMKAEKLQKELDSKSPPKEEKKQHVDSGITTTRIPAKLTQDVLEDKYYNGEIGDAEYAKKRKELGY